MTYFGVPSCVFIIEKDFHEYDAFSSAKSGPCFRQCQPFPKPCDHADLPDGGFDAG